LAGVTAVRSPASAQVPPPAAADAVTVTYEACNLQPGEAVLFTIDSHQPIDSVAGAAFGQLIAAFPAGTDRRWHAVVGIDVEATPGPSDISIEACTRDGARYGATWQLVVAAKKFGTRRLKVAPKFVNPPRSAVARITHEQERLAALFTRITRPRAWQGAFVPPVDGQAVENFGQLSVFNGVPWSRHRGADFASRLGAPVCAPNAGRVVMAEELYYSGNTVVLDHGGGLFSLLAHLSRMDVSVNDDVERSATVGAVGATGRVTAPHLHWTARTGAAAVDPLSLLAFGRQAAGRREGSLPLTAR